MHWVAFAILVFVVTLLQTTLAPFLAVHTIRPDFLVIVAIHFALAARTHDALMACWWIGLVMDLCSLSYRDHSNLGLNALSMGLIGLIIVKLRWLTFRDSVVTQLVATFLAAMARGVVVGWHMTAVTDQRGRLGEVVAVSIWTAAYTAVLAPYGHWMLRKLRNVLGIAPSRRLYSA